ncbi:MAG TPA: hypothetical protein PLA90_10385 [Candidatus Sumerlaeota bacterium]|nr:hypothetical protein [Candidatus Sumerlaeota bacterium]
MRGLGKTIGLPEPHMLAEVFQPEGIKPSPDDRRTVFHGFEISGSSLGTVRKLPQPRIVRNIPNQQHAVPACPFENLFEQCDGFSQRQVLDSRIDDGFVERFRRELHLPDVFDYNAQIGIIIQVNAFGQILGEIHSDDPGALLSQMGGYQSVPATQVENMVFSPDRHFPVNVLQNVFELHFSDGVSLERSENLTLRGF